MKISFKLIILIIGFIPFGIQGQVIDTLLKMEDYNLHFNIIKGKGMPEIIGLEKALIKLGYDKEFVLVAHSLGGLYATLFAVRNPTKIKGATFFDTSIPCFFTEKVLSAPGSPSILREIVGVMRTKPFPLGIPLIDMIAEKSVEANINWEHCHKERDAKSDLRIGIVADECSHYIFLQNKELAINAIVTQYARVQVEEKKNIIIEKGFAFEQTQANIDYGVNVRYNHSDNDLTNWGSLMIKQNQITQAFKILDLNTSLYPKSSVAYGGLGEAYFKVGDIESAKSNLQKSIALDPTNINSKQVLARISSTVLVSKKILSTYVGEYNLEGAIYKIVKKNDVLILENNGSKSGMYFTSNTNFFISDYNIIFEFSKGKDGTIEGFNFAGQKAVKIK